MFLYFIQNSVCEIYIKNKSSQWSRYCQGSIVLLFWLQHWELSIKIYFRRHSSSSI